MWNEYRIGAALARQTFQSKYLVVPNCMWPGSECDLLLVSPCLRISEVEIKISRSDLRADRQKDKWFDWISYAAQRDGQVRPRRQWPRGIWKHYYCLPAEIWTDDLLPDLGSPASGILLLREDRDGRVVVDVRRKARTCREAKVLTPRQCVDIARLANLRMWDAYRDRDRCAADARRQTQMAAA